MDLAADKRMIDSCLSGDRQAQYELYGKYCKGMFNVCLRMINDRNEAEDVLQNAFIEVFGKLKYFRYESAPGAWIKRIVVNQCINHLRKRRPVLTESGELPESTAEETGTDPELNVGRIRNAIAQMPDGYRTIFCLYAMEGYDHGEIAEIMDISESTSKSQYSRARSKLYDILKESGDINRLYE